jgi:hypothetical protein
MTKELNLTGSCPVCGKNLALVGRSHICRPAPKSIEPTSDGIALQSIPHPPGLIEKMAEAITAGKLSLNKRGRPRKTEAGFDKTEWQRDYMRKRREKAKP